MSESKEKLASASPRDLLLLLKDIESRSLQHVAELPQQHDMEGIWQGILFMVLGVPVGKRSRILVIDQNGIRAGLLVAGVQGLRHFKDEQSCAVPALESAFGRYVHKAFNLAGEVWPVFNLQSLVESSDFQVAAA